VCALATAVRPVAAAGGMLLIRPRRPPTFTAVIANAARFVVDHSPVISMKIRAAHVIDRSVVGEYSVMPIAAGIADPRIAETIVHAAVEADMVSPVTAVPNIKTAAPAPISRRPQRAYIGRKHPSAANPIVAGGPVGPVTGLPHITRPRANRLCVHRQDRWGDSNR